MDNLGRRELGILADEGLYIPILEEVEKLSEEYYENELRKKKNIKVNYCFILF